jgi:hypothetical protein
MNKLSDFKGEEALLLWADLLDGFTEICADKDVADALRAKKPVLVTAKLILERKPKEACNILLRIDNTPIDGLNLITRLAGLITEMVNDPTLSSFFGSLAEVKKGSVPIGSATVNTEESENLNTSSDM